jgi:two-component system, OmpR family, response regulator
MIAAMRILLAEDEPLIARFIARGLHAEGHHTTMAGDGDVAFDRLAAEEWDLLILDLMLPGHDGFWVLEQALRLHPQLPVLVLSARTATDTKVRALNAGASDYLSKPFALDELLARVKARLRASPPSHLSPADAGRRPQIDPRSRVLSLRDGRSVHLSAREYDLLEYLLRTPDEPVSRERILSAVWDYQFDPRSNVVDVTVGRLRRKLEADIAIETIRGGGYRLSLC